MLNRQAHQGPALWGTDARGTSESSFYSGTRLPEAGLLQAEPGRRVWDGVGRLRWSQSWPIDTTRLRAQPF